MKTTIITIVVLIAIGTLYFVNTQDSIETSDATEPKSTLNAGEFETYANQEIGLTFQYLVSPNEYTLIESEKGINDSEDFVYGVTLFRTTDYEDMQSGPDRGGPPSINIRVFDNTDSDLATWLAANQLLTNDQGAVEDIFVGGQEAVRYTWEGMFEGETIVLQNENRIYMIEGTYHTDTEDARKEEFDYVLNSMTVGFH